MEKSDENDGFSAPTIQDQIFQNINEYIVSQARVDPLQHPMAPPIPSPLAMNMLYQMQQLMPVPKTLSQPLDHKSPSFLPNKLKHGSISSDDLAATSSDSSNPKVEDSAQSFININSMYPYAIDKVSANAVPNSSINKIGVKPLLDQFYCDKHKNYYPTWEEYEHHIRSSHNSFKCAVCSKQFKAKQALNEHMKTHVHQCSKCARKFPTEKGLQSHLLAHKFECKTCKKLFNTTEILTEHIKKHKVNEILKKELDEEKTINQILNMNYYKCDKCEKGFETKAQLEQHLKDKHYVPCTECGKSFATATAMNAHFTAVHKKRDGSFVCSFDGKKFSTAYALEMHNKDKHSYFCNEHKKSFASQSALDAHMKAKKHSVAKK